MDLQTYKFGFLEFEFCEEFMEPDKCEFTETRIINGFGSVKNGTRWMRVIIYNSGKIEFFKHDEDTHPIHSLKYEVILNQ